MYIKQKERVFIRNIGDICYFQNRAHNTDIMFGGAAKEFAKFLSKYPKDEEIILNEVCRVFNNTDRGVLEKDLNEFFTTLEDCGFVVRDENAEDCNKKDVFDYSEFDSDRITFVNNKKKYSENETSIEMQKYLMEHPTIMSFQFEITKKCNERCHHCYVPRKDIGAEMDINIFEKTIKELDEIGTIGVILSGGEPMCHHQFIEFLRILQKYDFAVSILSNLTQLNDEIFEEFKRFRQISIQTSLYSMDPSIHDAVTKLPGSQEKTKAAIEKLVANNIIVQVSSPAIKINKDSFPAVIDWCENKMKIRAHTDYAIFAEADGNTNNLDVRLSLDECRTFINNLIEHDKNYQEMLKSQDTTKAIEFNRDPESILCGIGIDSAAMSVNGDVLPCSGFESMVCGNVQQRTLKDIWDNSSKMKMIRKLRYKDYPQCLSCENRAYCSLCLKRMEGESGDIHTLTKHFCDVAGINREVAEEWRKKLNER